MFGIKVTFMYYCNLKIKVLKRTENLLQFIHTWSLLVTDLSLFLMTYSSLMLDGTELTAKMKCDSSCKELVSLVLINAISEKEVGLRLNGSKADTALFASPHWFMKGAFWKWPSPGGQSLYHIFSNIVPVSTDAWILNYKITHCNCQSPVNNE